MNQIDGNDDIDWIDEDEYLCCICEINYVTKEYPICDPCDEEGNEYEDDYDIEC